MRDELFIPEHKTNILPLRWIVNGVFHRISMIFFTIGLKANDRIEWDSEYKWYNRFLEWFGWKWYKIFDKPYSKWGTTYVYNLSEDLAKHYEELFNSPAMDDYDENGVPYWEKWWHEDPVTGDAWRIVSRPETKDEA